MVHTAEIDPVDRGGVGPMERRHGLDVARQHHAAPLPGLPSRQQGHRFGQAGEAELDLGRDGHAVEVLLPAAGGDAVIDQGDELDTQRPSPSDHDLPMDQAVVHSTQHDRHQGTRMALPPAAAARAAASSRASER
jgi:hypothetical protein